MLLKENPGIDKDQQEITYRRWKYVEKEKGKKLDMVDEVATMSELLNQYISDLQFMSLHMFNWKWHDQQFQYIKDHLQESHLLQVLDFAQKFMNELGEEPQSLHWADTQTVIHQIVNYYKCPIDGETITHEHIMISDDLKHDKYAAKAFEDASMKSLLTLSFKLKCILQFCDNCSGHYKSKGPFEYISLSETPVIRSFFGKKHGTGPSDGIAGRVKLAAKRNRKQGNLIRSALEFYEFLSKHFEKMQEIRNEKSNGKCNHFNQDCFFITNIDRTKEF